MVSMKYVFKIKQIFRVYSGTLYDIYIILKKKKNETFLLMRQDLKQLKMRVSSPGTIKLVSYTMGQTQSVNSAMANLRALPTFLPVA